MVGERPSYPPPPPRHNTTHFLEGITDLALARLEKLPELVNWEQDVAVRWNATSKTLGPASEGPRAALSRLGRCYEPGPDNPTLQPIAD